MLRAHGVTDEKTPRDINLRPASLLRRVANFAAKPWRSQFRSFAFRWLRLFPAVPLPFRLRFGAWWLVRNDQIGATLLEDTYENIEHAFVEGFLQPGMTFLDIGANQGYYTLLASQKVGPCGKVFAFEPSVREVRRLRLHLRLNRCKNVELVTSALGAASGTENLHVVQGIESGCNSLRPPNVAQPTRLLSVSVERLDDVLKARGVTRVDFIKLDVEGAELSVLRGARELLTHPPRPILLVEVQDLRTQPWGYPAREIISYLSALKYEWFAPKASGELEQIALDDPTYDGNFVAIPKEFKNSLGEDENQKQLADRPALDSTPLISCPACGAAAPSASIERLGAYSLYPCGSCDLHFWHPLKMPEARWYEQMYGSRDARLLPLEPGHKYFLADPFAPKSGKLLDVGCGTGNFLLASRSAGFEVTGIELDPGAIRFIQTHLHIEDVFPLTISEFCAKHAAVKFSVITFFEVLEHQAEPAEFLQAVKSSLAPGGHIALSVPNRNRWMTAPDVLDYPPNHFLRWSPAAIKNFLAAQGFEILTLHEQPAGISHTARMMNSLLRTGLQRTIAGSKQPAFCEVMQMDASEVTELLAAKPTRRQRLVAALANVKHAACYPLAIVAWPWVRIRQLKGTYLYVLARLRH